jgi:class 3 adenylate cyclase/tetratricopeptide (TPR) repeat protein
MKCPKCQFNNPEPAKFCVNCGQRVGTTCPICRVVNAAGHKFCSECGQSLTASLPSATLQTTLEFLPVNPSDVTDHLSGEDMFAGERKYISVLFSDLSNYTGISERLDPEEVKEILSRIFDEITQVIHKYDGFVEKIIGDGMMVLFGTPQSHEDDAIRAVKAAFDIHHTIERLSTVLEERVGQPLAMHTGITTGLVVTNYSDLAHGRPGVAGDTINLASRLADLARPGEILVDINTYRQSIANFDFSRRQPTRVKGKTEVLEVYQAINAKKEAFRIHRHAGLRASLIGRKAELDLLEERSQRLKTGSGSIVSICGEAGTGKSRLVAEFKSKLDLNQCAWIESHAYAYTQKIPYYPLIDMLSRIWGIEEGDHAQQVRAKIENGVQRLIGPRPDIIPCLGSLHGLSYPQIEGMSPEVWSARLHEATREIISSLARIGQTVFCLEDLHWADSATISLLRSVLSEFRYPAMLICIYRPPFGLFTSHQINTLGRLHQEIRLKELSPSESQEMMESLLIINNIPTQLRQFIRDRTEGNPFYIEEMINSLVESGELILDSGIWQLAGASSLAEIPPTVHGVISARLDRLQNQSKRLLQEASVIGRAFLYEILKRVSSVQGELEHRFNELERIDLIRTRSLYPDLEFAFKHALTQEVGYASLLKKECQQIHQRTAKVMEHLFADRLTEFYETLAMHYRLGKSPLKAVHYLVKAGEKGLRRYALEESQQYFKDAFDLLDRKSRKTTEEKSLLIDVISQWAFVFYYRGDYKGLLNLLESHRPVADELADSPRLGLFYAWLGCALWHRSQFKASYATLIRAVAFGEEGQNPEAIGYACSWLSWTCTELGNLDEGLAYAKRAQELYASGQVRKSYIYFNSLAGMGYAWWHRGQRQPTAKVGQQLLDFGRQHANLRAMVLGHCCLGWSHMIAGDGQAAQKSFADAVQISADPWYSMFPKLAMCLAHAALGGVDQAENLVHELLAFSRQSGAEFLGEPAQFFQGLIWAVKGDTQRGLHIMEEVLTAWGKSGNRLRLTLCGHILAKFYLSTIEQGDGQQLGARSQSPDDLLQQTRHTLLAHCRTAEQIGATALQGQILLSLARVCLRCGAAAQAGEALRQAAGLFEACDAEAYRQETRQALSALQGAVSDPFDESLKP